MEIVHEIWVTLIYDLWQGYTLDAVKRSTTKTKIADLESRVEKLEEQHRDTSDANSSSVLHKRRETYRAQRQQDFDKALKKAYGIISKKRANGVVSKLAIFRLAGTR